MSAGEIQGECLILYRYINKQIFVTTLVVTTVLVMVLVSGRFIKYLAQAVAGDIPSDALFLIIALRMPEFLQMILPLSLFIAVLLVVGRLYSENEMAVIRASGIGQGRLARGLIVPIISAMGVVGVCSLFLTPFGEAKVASIFEQQDQRSALELLSPGRFHVRSEDRGQRATYAERLDQKEGVLHGVFISELRTNDDGEIQPVNVRASTGKVVEKDGELFLQLTRGVQYRGTPGLADFVEVNFDQAFLHIEKKARDIRPPKVRWLSSQELLERSDKGARAELQWRVSLIAMVPLVILIGLPLSKVNPRQGRFARMIPGLGGFLAYMGALLVLRSSIEDWSHGEPPLWMNMLWVHIVVALVVIAFYKEHQLRWWWSRRKSR